MPKSDSWHIDLLKMFKINDSYMELAIIDENQFRTLAAYMKIRHIIRQGYQYNLDWGKVKIALENIHHFLNDFETSVFEYIKRIK